MLWRYDYCEDSQVVDKKYGPQNVHKFDISAGNDNVSFDIMFSLVWHRRQYTP